MQLSREEGCGQWDSQSVTGFVVMVVVLVGKGWVDRSGWWEGKGERRGRREGKGQWREQGRFCSFSRDLARAGWRESVCGTWHEMTNDD